MSLHIDLHMHSKYSDDGEFTPAELVQQCKEAGVEVMSITDHDSARANAEARKEAQRLGIKYISGIEIDCTFLDINFHLLGYGIDDESPDFTELEAKILTGESNASVKRLELTRKLGFNISESELNAISDITDGTGIWTGEIFAEILLGKSEYLNHQLLKPYRENGDRGDNPYVNFYWDFYVQGKPCYVKVDYPKLEEAIDIIHKNGGKAVFAHPGHNLKGRFELFDEIVKTGINGVEVFCSYHNKETAEYFYKKAQQFDLIITCGSDYHGKTKPSVKLGETGSTLNKREIEKCLEF